MKWLKRAVPALGGLAAFLFLFPAQLFHHFWSHCFSSFELPVSLSLIRELYAETLSSVEEALRTFMPDADEIQEEIKSLSAEQRSSIQSQAEILFDPYFDQNFRFFIGKKNNAVMGYAAEDTVPGKWGPIRYMISISPEAKIKDVMVLEYMEKRGRPVAKKRFLKQFKGKTASHELQLMKDIHGVTGASISSRGMTNGIRKMLHVFTVVYGKN